MKDLGHEHPQRNSLSGLWWPHNRNLRLAPVLVRKGFNTIVFLPDESGNAVERFKKAELSVLIKPLHRMRATANPIPWSRLAAGFLAEVWMIRRLLRQRGIDVVLGQPPRNEDPENSLKVSNDKF